MIKIKSKKCIFFFENDIKKDKHLLLSSDNVELGSFVDDSNIEEIKDILGNDYTTAFVDYRRKKIKFFSGPAKGKCESYE